jgi:hypothetical protein
VASIFVIGPGWVPDCDGTKSEQYRRVTFQPVTGFEVLEEKVALFFPVLRRIYVLHAGKYSAALYGYLG